MNRYLYQTNPWWDKTDFDSGKKRDYYIGQLEKDLDSKIIQILTGLRRVGKSTIALQLVKYLINSKKIDPKKILYFSIEEPSISKTSVIDVINEFRTEHSIRSNTKIYVFIDEVQYRGNWEKEIKSLYDTENIKFILTGSSAMLLSERLSYLTGRYIKTQVYPLSFEEYLEFMDIKVGKSDLHLLIKHMESYLVSGGMPEYILTKPSRYLETTVESILFKDLVSKFQLRNPKVLTDLIYLLSDRIGTTSSSLRLSKILEINKDTILTYIDYLNKTYITSELPNYSTSRNKEIYNPPKIYFDDTGIGNIYATKENFGALAENAIFNHIRNKVSALLRVKFGYWYENKKEIDFVLSFNQDIYFIESKWVDSLDDINFKPLEASLKSIKPKKVLYITRSLKATKEIAGESVAFIPLYEFLTSDLYESLDRSPIDTK